MVVADRLWRLTGLLPTPPKLIDDPEDELSSTLPNAGTRVGLRDVRKRSVSGNLAVGLDLGRTEVTNGLMDDAAANAQRGELPIACTLDSKDGLSRMQRWQRLHELAIPVASLMDGELTVRYQRGPGVLDELRDLVEDERLCCAFVSWAVTEDDGQPVLRVTAPEGSPRDIEPIAVMFAASN